MARFSPLPPFPGRVRAGATGDLPTDWHKGKAGGGNGFRAQGSDKPDHFQSGKDTGVRSRSFDPEPFQLASPRCRAPSIGPFGLVLCHHLLYGLRVLVGACRVERTAAQDARGTCHNLPAPDPEPDALSLADPCLSYYGLRYCQDERSPGPSVPCARLSPLPWTDTPYPLKGQKPVKHVKQVPAHMLNRLNRVNVYPAHM